MNGLAPRRTAVPLVTFVGANAAADCVLNSLVA